MEEINILDADSKLYSHNFTSALEISNCPVDISLTVNYGNSSERFYDKRTVNFDTERKLNMC